MPAESWVAMTLAASLAPVPRVEVGDPVVVADSTAWMSTGRSAATPKGGDAGSNVAVDLTPVT